MTRIFIIAGEASGDVLGYRLMTALKRLVPGARFSGIGGARMAEAGLESKPNLSWPRHAWVKCYAAIGKGTRDDW